MAMFNSELLVYQRVATTMDSCNISYQPNDVGIVCDLPLNAEPAPLAQTMWVETTLSYRIPIHALHMEGHAIDVDPSCEDLIGLASGRLGQSMHCFFFNEYQLNHSCNAFIRRIIFNRS